MNLSEIKPPENPVDFEHLVADLFEAEIGGLVTTQVQSEGRTTLDFYIVSSGEVPTHIGIECKLKDNISNEDIDDILKRVNEFDAPLERLIIATTSAKVPEGIEYDVEYSVDIYSWPDIVERLLSHEEIFSEYYTGIVNIENLKPSVSKIDNIQKLEKQVNQLFIIANVAQHKDHLRVAKSIYEIILEVTEMEERTDWEIETRLNLADIHFSIGSLEEAKAHYHQSLQLADTLEEVGSVAEIPIKSGEVSIMQEEFEQVRKRFQESLETIGKPEDKVRTLDNLGHVERAIGRFDKAEDYYERSLAVKRELGDRRGEAESLANLGNVAFERAEFDSAEEYYEQSLAIKRELGDRRGEAESLANLGNVALERHKIDMAEKYHEQSLAIKRELGDRRGEAQSLANLGNVAFEQAEFDSAEEYFEQSMEIRRDIGEEGALASTLHNLGNVAQSRGDLTKAEEFYRRSLEIESNIGDQIGAALSLGNLGIVFQRRGEFEEATQHFEAALSIFRQNEAVREELKTIINLARTAEKIGEIERASEWYKQGLERTDKAELSETSEFKDNFRLGLARLEESEESTIVLYTSALTQILRSNPSQAVQLFAELWKRHDNEEIDSDSTAYSHILSAGVALIAHDQIMDEIAINELVKDVSDFDIDTDDMLDVIESNQDKLSPPALALFEYLRDGETELSPEELAEETSKDEIDIPELESSISALLLRELKNSE